jgi:hypothetical protein
VFDLNTSTSARNSNHQQDVWAAAQAAMQQQQLSSTHTSSSYVTPAHSSQHYTQPAGNGHWQQQQQQQHGYQRYEPPPMASPHNPFQRGKRKHSDPDVGAGGGRFSFGGDGRANGKAGAHSASLVSRLRSTVAAPFRWAARQLKGADLKKDDDASAEHRRPLMGNHANSFAAHQFGSSDGAGSDLAPNLSTRVLRALTLKNILFVLVMTLLVGSFYIWWTHDCEDEHLHGGGVGVDNGSELPSVTSPLRRVAPGGAGGHMNEELQGPANTVSLPGGGVVDKWIGSGSLQDFEQRYPFLHPVIHFFKRPLDQTGFGGASKHPAVAHPNRDIPFTLVSLLRDMTPDFLAENKASYIFQYNSLLSWLRITPHVIVYMDSAASCASLTARSEFRTVQCFEVPCMHDTIHRPLLNCIFDHSHAHSVTEAMGFVNGDIILSPRVKTIVNKIGSEFDKYLVVSRRTDTHLPEHLIDAYIANYHARDRADQQQLAGSAAQPFVPAVAVDTQGQRHVVADNVDNAVTYAAQHGTLHSEFGIDLFLYPKSTFKWMFPSFPPFLAGVYRWDNYFLTKMILHPSVATVDASQFGLLVHQQIDGGKDHSKRTGAAINDALVKQHLGSIYKLGHIKNVDYVLNSNGCPGPNCELAPNGNASVHVLYAKRANAHNWLAVIHVAAGEHIELNNFVCWAARISFRNFLFLTRDKDMYEEIVNRDMPVIFLDRSLVDQPSAPGQPPQFSDVESAASTLQRYDFLFSVLKAGYHFFYSSVRAVYLDDPLRALSRSVPSDAPKPSIVPDETLLFDVQMRGNATHVLSPPFAAPIAVRSTNYGQYFWKQIHDCADMNKHIADAGQWIDCIAHNWRILKGGVKKGVLSPWYFTDAQSFFEDKSSLTNGYFPAMINDQSVRENVNKFARLQQWGLLASHASSAVCKDDLPSHRSAVFSPPFPELGAPPPAGLAEGSPEFVAATNAANAKMQDFRLKVRVLTFNRHASLQRLLDIMQTAYYDNDQVDLEISIDYPTNMSDTAVIDDWRRTQLVSRSFVWKHGKIEVIQQRTHIGLVGQWTMGWYPADDNKELMLFLEDDTGVSPYYYRWCKRMIQTYYLNASNYDPSLYGFALQTQHTILGETLAARFGVKHVPEELNRTAEARGLALDSIDREYFRYQLVGTWGGVFFPQHWREFLIWLREKQFVHAEGTSPVFQPCVPSLIGNDWWKAKPHKVWSQWFARFAFEKGWYNLYTNFPGQLSLVGNFREGGENFAISKGLMNDMVDATNTPPGSPLYERIHSAPLPVPTSKIPLYDFHFNEVSQGGALKSRLAVWGNPLTFPNQCITMKELSKALKDARDKEKAKQERIKKELAQKAKEDLMAAQGQRQRDPTTRDKIEETMAALHDQKAVPADAIEGASKDKKKAATAAAAKGGKKPAAGDKKGKAATASKDKKDATKPAAKGKDAAKPGATAAKAVADKKKKKDAKPVAAGADKKKAAAAAASAKKDTKAPAAKKPTAAKPAAAAKKPAPTKKPAKKAAAEDEEEAVVEEVAVEAAEEEQVEETAAAAAEASTDEQEEALAATEDAEEAPAAAAEDEAAVEEEKPAEEL